MRSACDGALETSRGRRSTKLAVRALRRLYGQPALTGPLSVQTVPQGQPLAPGAQLENVAQLAQFAFAHCQLCPPFETTVPCTYELHADVAKRELQKRSSGLGSVHEFVAQHAALQ